MSKKRLRGHRRVENISNRTIEFEKYGLMKKNIYSLNVRQFRRGSYETTTKLTIKILQKTHL